MKDVPAASDGLEVRKDEYWHELDNKFRRDLPDDAYLGRLAYRGLVMRACPRIRKLDGVEITDKERTKAMQVLSGILSKNNGKEEGLGRG